MKDTSQTATDVCTGCKTAQLFRLLRCVECGGRYGPCCIDDHDCEVS